MKRLALALILLVSVGACASADRPEGTVERWLSSLNQGSAGRPDRYAVDAVTATVAPSWDTEEPGWIETVSVGAATNGEAGDRLVTFEIVPTEGDAVSGTVTLGTRTLEDGSTQPVVSDVELGAVSVPPGAWQGGAGSSAWLIASGIGVLIALAATALVGAVDRAARRI